MLECNLLNLNSVNEFPGKCIIYIKIVVSKNKQTLNGMLMATPRNTDAYEG